jgi:EAL and modified HD-GYP domain-containing signal transduction protein
MSESFIARQPIFDRRLKLFAYELLFRSGRENFFKADREINDEVIVNSTMLFDVQSLVGDAVAFFNVDAAALQREVPRLLSPQHVVLEILESVEPTAEFVGCCAALAAGGYVFALDDFLDEPKWQPLIPIVHYLKVDFRGADADLRARIAAKYLPFGIHLLAEKVETEAELAEAKKLGYSYFQGYFFCKPSVISTRGASAGQPASLQLLQAAGVAELDYPQIEEIFRQAPSLTYRLLRFLNSPALAIRVEIRNVRQAIGLLGEREFRRWIAIVALVAMAENKPSELVQTALVRACFCEALAPHLQLSQSAPDLFLMGLLSAADAMLDRPLAQVLAELCLSTEISSALLASQSRYGSVLKIALAYEHGDWNTVAAIAAAANCPEDHISRCFYQAIQRANLYA